MKDTHIHSGFLPHTKSGLYDMVKTAHEVGLKEITIVEHFDWLAIKHPEKTDRETLRPEQLTYYMGAVTACRYAFPIKITVGLEVDYFLEYKQEIKEFLQPYNFEQLTGSCHYLLEDNKYVFLKNVNFNSPEIYECYFATVKEAVESKMFYQIAHVDQFKKYMKKYDKDISAPYITNILKAMIVNNVGLEVILKGIEDVGETYPSVETAKEYLKIGGQKLTLGSDAHSADGIKRSVEYNKKVCEEIYGQ
ncbi:MAG: histidinol-phosphatase HisJ family protein [Patescibacteria group bacterium]